MKKKVLILTGVAVALLIAVVAAALNAVFTVAHVEVHFSVCSSQGEAEAVLLQGELDDAYVGRSTTFLKLEEVEAAVERYPAFRVVSAEKRFPRTVVLSVEERREAYAFRRENGIFAILDEEGVYLYDSERNVNRRGGENILLEGFAFSAERAGEKVSGGHAEELFAMFSVFFQKLGDARANIVSVTLSSEYMMGDYFQFEMREGVTVDIFTPGNFTEEKAEEAIEEYLSLSEAEKTYGYSDAIDYDVNNDGVVDGFTVSNHKEREGFTVSNHKSSR